MGFGRSEPATSIIDRILEATCCHRNQRSLDISSLMAEEDLADARKSSVDLGSDRLTRLFQTLLKEKLACFPDELPASDSAKANEGETWKSDGTGLSDEERCQDRETSRKALRVVDIFSAALARQAAETDNGILQCCVWGPVMDLLRRPQAISVWQDLVLLFPKLLARHASDLLGKNSDGHILCETFGWLLFIAALDDRDAVRQKARSILRLLLKSAFTEHGGLVQMKVISTMALMDILEFRVTTQETDTPRCDSHSSAHSYRRSKSVCTTQSRDSSSFEWTDSEAELEQRTFNRSETFGNFRDSSYSSADWSPRAKVDSPSRQFKQRPRREKVDRRSGDFVKVSWSDELDILKRPGPPSCSVPNLRRKSNALTSFWTADSLESILSCLYHLESLESNEVSGCHGMVALDLDVNCWKEALRDLVATLQHVFQAWSEHHKMMERQSVDRILLAETCLAVSRACFHVPDLSIQWLLRLSRRYKEDHAELHQPEAAQCLVACASIIIQHMMRSSEGSLWGIPHLRTLQRICPDMVIIFPKLLGGRLERLPSLPRPISQEGGAGLGSLSQTADVDCGRSVYYSLLGLPPISNSRPDEQRLHPSDSNLEDDFLDEKVRDNLADALIQISKERISVDTSDKWFIVTKGDILSRFKSRSLPTINGGRAHVIGSAEINLDRALEHLHEASELFREAGFLETAAELIELTIPVYKNRKAYKELIKCHAKLAAVCSSVCSQAEVWGEPTTDAAYFRVGFFGDKFGPRLGGKQFIYREDRHTHLSDVTDKIGNFYEKQLGGKQFLRIISDPTQIQSSSLIPGIGYLQIIPVEPVFGTDKANQGTRTLLRTFYFSTRLTRSTAYDLSFRCSCGFKGALQKRRKTVLTVQGCFPNLLGRLEVVQTDQVLISLAEHIVDSVELWTRKLRGAMETAAMQLHRILQGILSAVYTHHILTVISICFKPPGPTGRHSMSEDRRKSLGDDMGNEESRSPPSSGPLPWTPCTTCLSAFDALQRDSASRERLKKAVTHFVATIRKALKVLSEHPDRRDWRVQASLSDKVHQLLKELSVIIPKP